MENIPIIYIDTEEDEEKYLTEYKYSIHTKILESIEKSRQVMWSLIFNN